MLWSATWSDGHSELVECEGNINSAKYVSILQKGQLLIFSSDRMSKVESLFMEDRTPCHTAQPTQNWFRQNGINKLHGQVSPQICTLWNTFKAYYTETSEKRTGNHLLRPNF